MASVVGIGSTAVTGASGEGWVASVSKERFIRFFLFFLASAVTAAGPLVIATWAMVVDLGFASLDDGAVDMCVCVTVLVRDGVTQANLDFPVH